jgi:hypothetical protein
MDVGVEFNQYIVVEHIGRGGMADVWSARDKRLNRTVAIKTIVRDMSQDVEPVKLFEREAKMIAALEHPHILPIYDFGEFEGQLYIVMRYVTGGSLEKLLSDGPLTTGEVLRVAKAIGSALDHAHSQSVIHLDLKPSNILMDSNRSPYLADFGLATVLGPEGRAANPGYGTLLYMAPEQLTAGELDHRADIYSFAIMLYQMLTGELPFDATTSLALKQLQFQDDLPELDKLSEDLADVLLPVLRRGTALEPSMRPETLMEMVEELEAALSKVSGSATMAAAEPEYDLLSDITVDLGALRTVADQDEMAKREAVDIYNKARRVWASGQGRFLLGVTHFMVMNDFYMRADEIGLSVDENGLQMLLRGALEYDHEVDFWWNKLDDDNRRWVALHAVRSESAPARVRALYRLETLPDSNPPRIPMLVAQTLQAESSEPAKIAALQVLGTRAQREKPNITGTFVAVKQPTGLTGRLLTATTRIGIQLDTPKVWREVVFNPEIDGLLADIALEAPEPAVAELAARTIGRIRSLTAVAQIGEAQRAGSDGALLALALIRDEAPSLPSVVSPRGRLYAWLANSWRRLTDNPLHIVWRFIFALIGGWVAMGAYVWVNLPSEAIFTPDRSGKTISIGLTFGVFVGVLVLLAGELPGRLRGFWPVWMQGLVSLVLGVAWGALTWAGFTWFFLNYDPSWDVMIFAGLGLALGFILTAILGLRGWLAFVVTAVTAYIPIYIMYQFNFTGEWTFPIRFSEAVMSNPPAIVYFREPDQVFSYAIPMLLLIAFGGHAQLIWRDAMKFIRRLRRGR